MAIVLVPYLVLAASGAAVIANLVDDAVTVRRWSDFSTEQLGTCSATCGQWRRNGSPVSWW